MPTLCDVIESLIKRGFAVSRKRVGRRLQLQFNTARCKSCIGLDHRSPDLLDCRIKPVHQRACRKAVRNPNHIALFAAPSAGDSWRKVWSRPIWSPVPHIVTLVP
ncbi:hypothetical protein D3C75_674640 [compost metagenome]